MFRGTFQARVDEKGRLKLPAPVAKSLEEKYGSGATFFVTSLTGDIVLIYALAEWERLEDILSKAPQFDKLKRKFLFQTSHYGEDATIDAQGRLLIPSKLRDQAGMKGEVKLNWQSTHVEVLNQVRYEFETEQNRFAPEDFQDLAKLGI